MTTSLTPQSSTASRQSAPQAAPQAAPQSAPPTQPPSSSALTLDADTQTKIDTYVAAHKDLGRFSGNVLVRLGTQTLCRSYSLANRAHNVANATHTKFRIGSITKQFTAAAILQLQDQGLLEVQAPVATYLPDYPNGADLTLHHLLSHSAGIPEYLDGNIFPDLKDWLRQSSPLTEIIDRFKDLPLEFTPGDRFKYSNSGYALLHPHSRNRFRRTLRRLCPNPHF